MIQQLERLSACKPAIEWAKTQENAEVAWQACERGDWMLWVVGKTIKCDPWTDGRKPLLACALDCAELAKDRWGKRTIDAVAVLRQWIAGEATRSQAAYAAAAADAYAAAYAADAASASAAYADTRYTVLKQCAEIVRKHYPSPPVLPG